MNTTDQFENTGTGPVPVNTGYQGYVAPLQPSVVFVTSHNLTFVPTQDTASGKSIAIYSNGNYLTTLNASERAELKVLINSL